MKKILAIIVIMVAFYALIILAIWFFGNTWFFNTSLCYGQDSSNYLTTGDFVIEFEEPEIQLSINWDGFIEIYNKDGNKLILDFTADTVRCEGYVLEINSFADTFCWAVIEMMNNSYSQQWERMVYMGNKYQEYEAALRPKYLKALELYIEQLREQTE